MKPRKVLIFSLVYYPRHIGGAEVAVKEITDRISTGQIEFDMVTLRKQESAFEQIGNVGVYRVGVPWRGKNNKSSRIFPLSKLLFIPLAFLKARQLHKENHYDVIWPIMASYAGFSAFLFKKLYPTVPMLLTVQEGDNFEKRQGIFKSFFRKIFASADKIQAISKFLAEWSLDMGAKCPIETIPNGVDLDLFSRQIPDADLNALKLELDKKDNDIYLITTSRLVKKNAVGDVIDSLQYLSKNIKFLILGTGYEEESLRTKVVKLKLEDRVKFIGFVPHNEMPKYLKVSDIFIRPALSEGLGNSFLEAMAAGIPVIGTQVGGIPDFLKDGETGLFCEVNNPKSITQKVEKLIKDRESRDYIIKQAKEMVYKKYSWDGVVDKMKGLFEFN